MRSYIAIGNSWCSWRHDLSNSDLRNIGEFTTENILTWLKNSKQPFDNGDPLRNSSITLVEFHAVCGDKDLRWETTEPWTPYDGVPVVYGNSPPVVYDTIYPSQAGARSRNEIV
jgi:hypothetical protein